MKKFVLFKNQSNSISFFLLIVILLISNRALSVASFNSGNCLYFNGTTAGVTFTNNDLNLASSNKLTVTAWVKWDNKAIVGSWANIVALNKSTGNNGDEGQFWLQHNSTNTAFEFAVQTTTSRLFVQSTTNPTPGVWYYVAGVYDGTKIYMYINGVLESQTSLTGNINNYQTPFNLAFGQWANPAGSYRRFSGSIDEVAIWNVANTQNTIRANMCKKLQGNESGLMGYWRMSENSGTSVKDLTKIARNGVSANTTIVRSGAPVGDACTYTYGGSSLAFKHPNYNDSLVVSNLSAAVTGIYIYRIDTTPNVTAMPNGISTVYTDYYYGVYLVNATTQTYKTSWYVNGYPGVSSILSLSLIFRTNNSSVIWSDLSAILNTSNTAITKASQLQQNEYALATKGIVLPIELISFTAFMENNSVKLNWVTDSECNNDFYTIERGSDGIYFETLAIKKAIGTSLNRNEYTVYDGSPLDGISYYRLKQTDLDGKTKIFPIVAVEKLISQKNEMTVFPIPFYGEEFNVCLMLNTENSILIIVHDLNSHVVFSQDYKGTIGTNNFNINCSTLASGGYIVSAYDHEMNFIKTTKVIKN